MSNTNLSDRQIYKSPDEAVAFSALCRSCGAQVGIDLTTDDVHCNNCGSNDPLSGKILNYFKEIRRRLKSQDILKQKIQHKNFVLAFEFKITAVLLGIVSWLFALGIWAIIYFTSNIRDTLNWWELLSHKQNFSLNGDIYYPLFWWMAYINITGIIITFLMIQRGLYYFKKFPSIAGAIPPKHEGAPSRCRCCGAALTGDGLNRTCGYCGADNIVTGKSVFKQYDDTETALRKMLHGVQFSIQDKFLRTWKIEKLLIIIPAIISVFLPWLLLFCNLSFPVLWIVPLILLILSVIYYSKTKAYKFDGFMSVYNLKMGCKFYLNDEPFEVIAKFMPRTGKYGEAQDAYIVNTNNNDMKMVVLTYSTQNEPDAFLYLPTDDTVKLYELEMVSGREIRTLKLTSQPAFFLHGDEHVITYCPVKDNKRYVYVWGEESANKKNEADMSFVFSGHFNSSYIRF